MLSVITTQNSIVSCCQQAWWRLLQCIRWLT